MNECLCTVIMHEFTYEKLYYILMPNSRKHIPTLIHFLMHVVNKLVKTIWFGCANVVFQYQSNILLSCCIVYGWYRLIRLLSLWKQLLSVNTIVIIYWATNKYHFTYQMNPVDEQVIYDCNLSNTYEILNKLYMKYE